MSSLDPESISSGMSLPVWMRPRVEKNDIDGISFSPPPHDESFFYIRYPIAPTPETDDSAKPGFRSITTALKVDERRSKQHQLLQNTQQVDFSKHTEPCKRFLRSTDTVTSPVEGVKNPPKSFGTDDGFKGPGAACGSSIVKVAQQMVSGRTVSARGFKIASLDQTDTDVDNAFYTKTIEDQQIPSSKLIQPELSEINTLESSSHMTQNSRLLVRRGSKSLPTSPLGSPKSMRKYQPNPYFTGTFAFSNASNAEGRGWFLSSLLGVQREATSSHSISHIEEESADAIAASTKNQTESTKDLSQKVLKAKPSELREMNFWSPTSM